MFGRGKKPTSPKVAENAAYLRKHPEVQVALDAALNACLLAQGRAWPRELDPIRYIASAMRVGPALRAQLAMMDVEHLAVASTLADIDQDHLFKDWPAVGTDDDAKRAFFAQAAELDSQYPGGLRSYYENAKACLAAAKAGENPFEGVVACGDRRVPLSRHPAPGPILARPRRLDAGGPDRRTAGTWVGALPRARARGRGRCWPHGLCARRRGPW